MLHGKLCHRGCCRRDVSIRRLGVAESRWTTCILMRSHADWRSPGRVAGCWRGWLPHRPSGGCWASWQRTRRRRAAATCACDPPCGICQTCDAQTGSCIPDPAQQGDACGKPGQVCQPDGTCWCDATSCGTCRSCHRSGECTNPCGSAGCCDGETCQPGLDDAACGNGGVTCEVCTGQEKCLVNEENEYLCTCVPACTGKACGAADGCGGVCQTGSCGQCQTCQAGVCVTAADGTACDTGNLCVQASSCQAGACAVQSEVSCPAPSTVCRTAACNPATGRCVESPRAEGYPCDVEGLCLERHSTCNGGGFCIAAPVRCQDSRDNCCLSGAFIGQCRRLGGAPCSVGAQCCSNTCWSSGTCA